MARFSNLKTAVKKIRNGRFLRALREWGRVEQLIKKTTIAAVFCKVFSRLLGSETDKLPSGMRRRYPVFPFLD
jgi:hypothetical protein